MSCGNSGLFGSPLDGRLQTLNVQTVHVHHDELLFAIGNHQCGGHHTNRVDTDSLDVGLGSSVHLSDADRRRHVRPSDPRKLSGRCSIFGSVLDQVAPAWRGKEKQNANDRPYDMAGSPEAGSSDPAKSTTTSTGDNDIRNLAEGARSITLASANPVVQGGGVGVLNLAKHF